MGTFLQCGSLEILMEMLMKVSWPLKSSVSTIIALFINDRGPIELDITPVVDALLPDILKSTVRSHFCFPLFEKLSYLAWLYLSDVG
jgi:hypothetical protein